AALHHRAGVQAHRGGHTGGERVVRVQGGRATMSRRTCSPWTPAEEALIREHYPTLGAAGMHERGMLTYRSHNAIRVHACGMGLRLNEEAYAAMQRARLLAIGKSKRLGMMIDPPPEELA